MDKLGTEVDNDNLLNDTSNKLKMFAGIVLLVIGIFVSIWILSIIGNLLNGKVDIPFIQIFSDIDPDVGNILTPSGAIKLPPITFLIVGYGIMIGFLSLIVIIAKTFLETGARLLMSDIKLLLEKLIRGINKLPQKNSWLRRK